MKTCVGRNYGIFFWQLWGWSALRISLIKLTCRRLHRESLETQLQPCATIFTISVRIARLRYDISRYLCANAVAIRYFTVSLRICNRYQRYLVWARYWPRWFHQHRPEFAECALFSFALVKCRRCEIWACEISPTHPPTHQFHNREISE